VGDTLAADPGRRVPGSPARATDGGTSAVGSEAPVDGQLPGRAEEGVGHLLQDSDLRAQAPGADFLFERPNLRLGLHGGYAAPRASSEIFDFTSERLTVEPRDFDAFTLMGELALRIDERLDVSFEMGFSRAEVPSEFRDWVDTDDRPIEQETAFTRTPLTVSVKGYLRDRGRRVSRFAWVPGDWSPFAGAGVGWMWYEFEQSGDFVDFETLDIFRDRFRTSGAAPTAHVLAGVDVSLSPRLVLTGQGRYRWASAEMGRDFLGFDEIDLSGFEATIGISARF